MVRRSFFLFFGLKVFNFTLAKFTSYISQPFRKFITLNVFASLRFFLERFVRIQNVIEQRRDNQIEVLAFRPQKGANNELIFFETLLKLLQRSKIQAITIILLLDEKNEQKYFAIGNIFRFTVTFEFFFDQKSMQDRCDTLNCQPMQSYISNYDLNLRSPLDVMLIPRISQNNAQIYLKNFGFDKKVCVLAPNSKTSLTNIIEEIDEVCPDGGDWLFLCLFDDYSDVVRMPNSKCHISYPGQMNFTFFEAAALSCNCDILVGDENIFSKMADLYNKRVTPNGAKLMLKN